MDSDRLVASYVRIQRPALYQDAGLFLRALSHLLRLDVCCLLAFRARLHVKAGFLAFLERLDTFGLNSEKCANRSSTRSFGPVAAHAPQRSLQGPLYRTSSEDLSLKTSRLTTPQSWTVRTALRFTNTPGRSSGRTSCISEPNFRVVSKKLASNDGSSAPSQYTSAALGFWASRAIIRSVFFQTRNEDGSMHGTSRM